MVCSTVSATDPPRHFSDSRPPPWNGELVRRVAAIGVYWRALWRIEALFLSKEDCDALELSLEDMLAAVEMGLDAHRRNDVLLPLVAGLRPGRESDRERILFRHKGFAISDIVLGHLAFEKAKDRGVGTTLPYYAPPRDE